VATVLREACRGLTVLLVDHDMEFISHFADLVCCLEHGKFDAVGSPDELASQPGLFRDLLEGSQEDHPEAAKGAPGPVKA
jgi:ABC-type uncharacterized transport system ATPase subunit